eukprot:TRINITY_DN1377_c0_g1_i7.p1 TRINITY_DN1377_c0_g1~~TRINITY_DN1377_c0_g1_i7.p1  ORF type:complete len:359 (+),score=35.19 TRINITY_DN1377_c0_g1_i7:205-1281(+)
MKAVYRYIIALVVSLTIAISALLIAGRKTCQGVRFFVIGDWGRNGSFSQRELGAYMNTVAEKFQPEFIISTGDNFYPSGLSSADDPQFSSSFMQIYKGSYLKDVPWHVVLGNHDYASPCGECTCKIFDQSPDRNVTDHPCCNSPLWQLGLTLKNRDPRWNSQRTFDKFLAGGRIHLLFIDTSPFVEVYRQEESEFFSTCEGGVNDQCWECQLREIEYRLNTSNADWKIVVGHHTIYSNGIHLNTSELVQHLDPILRQNQVQLYLNGHDHDLEHIYFGGDSIHYVTSGAGSSTRWFKSTSGSWFQWDKPGFVAVTIYPKTTQLDYYGLDAGKLFTMQIQQDGQVKHAKKFVPNRYAQQL